MRRSSTSLSPCCHARIIPVTSSTRENSAMLSCAPVRARSMLDQDLCSEEGRPRQVFVDAEVEGVESMLLIRGDDEGLNPEDRRQEMGAHREVQQVRVRQDGLT